MEHKNYVKYSNDRAINFQIVTEFVTDTTESSFFLKRPYTKQSTHHVNNIYFSYETLVAVFKDSKIKVNNCTKINEGIKLEYLNGISLSNYLDNLIKHNKHKDFLNTIESYFDIIATLCDEQFFIMTNQFIGVFGEWNLPKGLRGISNISIDMIFDNIIIQDGWNLIDYEWCFDFPIPLNFIYYRALNSFFSNNEQRTNTIDVNSLYKYFDISNDEILIYAEMEYFFQKQYVEENYFSLSNFEDIINNRIVHVEKLIQNNDCNNHHYNQVFKNNGSGFSEENSFFIKPNLNEKVLTIKIEIDKNTQSIRIDPCECPCIIILNNMYFENEDGCRPSINISGVETIKDEFVNFENDPQIVVSDLNESTGYLHLSYMLLPMDQTYSFSYMQLARKIIEDRSLICRYKADLTQLNKKNVLLFEDVITLTAQYKELVTYKDTLESDISILDTKYKELERMLDNLENSPSMKITKPLRFARSLIKGK